MWLGICGSCAAGADRAARWAISWWRATRRGNDLRSYWCCWYCCCRGRGRWWWCWRCQCRWLQLDATWQCTAPLTCCQAGEQAGPLHAVARRTTDLCFGAVVGAIRCADDGVVVVARQRVALHNCKRGGSRRQQRAAMSNWVGIEICVWLWLTLATWWRSIPALVKVTGEQGASDHLVSLVAGIFHQAEVTHGAIEQTIRAMGNAGGQTALDVCRGIRELLDFSTGE